MTVGNYEPLLEHLKADGRGAFRLTHAGIRAALGFDIDRLFPTYKKEAAHYGYAVGKTSTKAKRVTFNKL
jgi:hypothetical protein